MISDTEIKEKGLRVLFENLEPIEAERFIVLLKTDTFNYTRWRQTLWEDIPLEELYKNAESHWKKKLKSKEL